MSKNQSLNYIVADDSMKITVFTSTQPRHQALLETLSNKVDEVFAVQVCKSIYPGQTKGIYPQSGVMSNYFNNVNQAEERVFGPPRFVSDNIKQLILQRGDLNLLPVDLLKEALNSDAFIVFGCDFIKPPLVDVLVEKKAINIHMGVSPYYRGMSCNFWALHDRLPQYVGATIHYLTRGLDSGPIIFHALPRTEKWAPFEIGMHAVKSAHEGLVEKLLNGRLLNIEPTVQDRSKEIKYVIGSDFTDERAAEFLSFPPEPDFIEAQLKYRNMDEFLNPYIG